MSKPYQIPPMYLGYTAESVEQFPRYKIMHDKTDNFFFIYVKFAMPHHGLALEAMKGGHGEQLKFTTLEDTHEKNTRDSSTTTQNRISERLLQLILCYTTTYIQPKNNDTHNTIRNRNNRRTTKLPNPS